VFWVYLESFPFLHLGYGAALALLFVPIVLVFTVIQMILTRRSHA
jgi:multiple sugar transport system permease protein